MTIIFVGFKSPSPAECEVSRFFLHAEHALSDTLRGVEGKMMAFFHFYPVALWHSLNGPFVSKQGKQGRGSRPRSGLIVVGESRAGTSLSEGSCCRNLLSCTSLPAAPRMCLCVCTHTACPERRGSSQPLHGHAQPPKDPASNLQSFIFLPPGALRSMVSPRPP